MTSCKWCISLALDFLNRKKNICGTQIVVDASTFKYADWIKNFCHLMDYITNYKKLPHHLFSVTDYISKYSETGLGPVYSQGKAANLRKLLTFWTRRLSVPQRSALSLRLTSSQACKFACHPCEQLITAVLLKLADIVSNAV